MYYEPSTQTTYSSVYEFRLAHRDTSYGDLITEEERNQNGLFTILSAPPEHDADLQTIVKTGVQESNGQYYAVFQVVSKGLTAEQIDAVMLKRFTDALTDHLDNVAKERRYDNRITCTIRAGYPGPFQQEGIAFATWMDNCNAAAYQIWADVRNGQRSMPASIQAFIDELPTITWPPAPVAY